MARENARRFLVKMAIALFVGAGALADLAYVYGRGNIVGLVIFLGGAVVCAVWGGVQLWQAWRVGPTAEVALPMDGASVEYQVKQYKKILWMSAFAFPILTVWTAWDLHQLETGAVKEVSIAFFLAPIYHHLGYWPTVFFLPILGAFCIITFIRRIRRLRATNDPHA